MFGHFRRHGFGFLVGEDSPAGLGFHGIHPCAHGVFGAVGADFCDIGLEGHFREKLAVDAADLRLVAVVVRRAEELAGDAAAGDGLEIPFRWIGLDGGFRDEAVFPRGIEKVAQRLLLGEEDGLVELAAVEGFVFLGDLDDRAATDALGEDDLRDVEQRVDAGDLLDLLADELDGGLFRDDGDGDAFGGRDEFLTADLRAAASLEVAAITTFAAATVVAPVVALAAAVSASATVSAFAAAVVFAPVIAAALRVLALGGFVGVLGGWLGFRTRPRGAEREFGQKAIKGIGRVFAHGGKDRDLVQERQTCFAVDSGRCALLLQGREMAPCRAIMDG